MLYTNCKARLLPEIFFGALDMAEIFANILGKISSHLAGPLIDLSRDLAPKIIAILTAIISYIEFSVETSESQLEHANIQYGAAEWIADHPWFEKFYDFIDTKIVGIVVGPIKYGLLGGVATIFVVIIVYLIMNVTRWRRARIFVSYQHAFENIASIVEVRFGKTSIIPIKLPFVDSPDHNSLLDSVKAGISKADLIVCIPGEKPSFVEHEVAMAFALGKPLLFFTTSESLSRIPDTAKHGYPVVNLFSLDEGGWSTFVALCLYICRRNIALIYMCLAPLNNFLSNLFTFLVPLFIAVVFIRVVDSKLMDKSVVLLNYATMILIALVFIGTFLPYMFRTLSVAKKFGEIVGTRRFDIGLAPDILMLGLRKADVADILFKGGALADHERADGFPRALASEESQPKEKIVPPPDITDQDVQNLHSKASAGDATSQLKLGELLCSGIGSAPNKIEASVLFRKAAEQGLAEAQYNLGLMFEKGDGVEQNKTRAKYWYLRAAEQGHASAQNSVAGLCRGAVALRWYEAAAAQGNASAAYNAGRIYFYGIDETRDRYKARVLFEKAAESSFTLANYALGVMYENGLGGVKRDRAKAEKYYALAAADGDADAKKRLKVLSKRAWQFWK
jgi:TPR repeat protein